MTPLACSTLAFRGRPLDEALAGIRKLGFERVDLCLIEGWSHPDGSPSQLDAGRIARTVDRHAVQVVSVNTMLGDGDDAARQLDEVLTLAHSLGARVITYAAAKSGTSLDDAATEIAPLVEATRAAGIAAAVETHVHRVTEIPTDAVRLVELVPGLGITLDPSHYWAGPANGQGVEVVYPYVRQLHVRDAGRGGLDYWQVDFGGGEIDFLRLLSELRATSFDGPVSIEYIAGYDVEVETNLLRAREYLEQRAA